MVFLFKYEFTYHFEKSTSNGWKKLQNAYFVELIRTKIFLSPSLNLFWKWGRCPFPAENCRTGTRSCQFWLSAMCRTVISLGVEVRILIYPPSSLHRKFLQRFTCAGYPVLLIRESSSMLIQILFLIHSNGFPSLDSIYLLPSSM